jgi:hypothetical protein
VSHRGRTVLAMDCVLAGAEWHRGRPLNSIVRLHSTVPFEPTLQAMATGATELR